MDLVEEDKDKLEKATKEVYKQEFHKGKLNANTGKYEGTKVADIKDILIKDFKEQNLVSSMWEPTSEVVCRCTTKCHVKILESVRPPTISSF